MTHASLYTDGKLSKGRIGTAKNIGATSGPKHGPGGVSAARGARGQNRAKTRQPTATPAQRLGVGWHHAARVGWGRGGLGDLPQAVGRGCGCAAWHTGVETVEKRSKI